MLKWYKNLYVGDTAKKKQKKIIRKINDGSLQPGVYVITLASNCANQLDVFSADYLLQENIRAYCPPIIGVAKGYYEAIDIVQMIVEEVYQKTGTAEIRAFLEENLEAETNRWSG